MLSETREDYGLKEDWRSVQRILEEIIPVYDRTNRYISLGTDVKLRKRGIELLQCSFGGGQPFSVLDLGCGTGKMTMELIEAQTKEKKDVLLCDPLVRMMRVAKSRTGREGLLAVFESLPVRRDSFDAAMAGFSIRDARKLADALK
ncbi:MAG: class I SAM-dependent methyltransferase, partial [Nitrososphaerales archaeon]